MERFARWLLRIAGVYGLIALVPLYFQERQFGIDHPPAITHPEFFYGFVGVAVAWQVAFLIMSSDPLRYRPLLPACVMEKFCFGIAAMVLFAIGRLRGTILIGATIDLILGVLFLLICLAWRQPRQQASTSSI